MKYSLLRRTLTVLTAGALSLSLLGGCAGGGRDDFLRAENTDKPERDNVSLTFFGYKADAMNLTATEAALQSFMSKHENIHISYEGIKGSDYWYAFDKRDAAGKLDDVFMMHHDHIITMSEEGKLADLSDLPGLENYTDRVRNQFINDDGTVYFLPTSVSTYNLYVNYDLLKAHGMDVPENWEDFQKCCDYFADKGIVPIIANNRNSLPTLIISKGLFDTYQQSDVDVILKEFNENPALLAEALASGVDQIAQMIKLGWFDAAEVLATEQTSDDLELFVKGDRPFMISGGWASSRVIAKAPAFTYGVYPYPILDDGSVLSFQIDTCISVNANSKSLKEAKEFVSYLIQPDVIWEFCDSQASYTPLNDKRLPSEKTLIPSTKYLTNGRAVLRNEYRLNLPVELALSNCSNTLLRGGTVDEAKAVLLQTLSE